MRTIRICKTRLDARRLLGLNDTLEPSCFAWKWFVNRTFSEIGFETSKLREIRLRGSCESSCLVLTKTTKIGKKDQFIVEFFMEILFIRDDRIFRDSNDF